MIVAKRLVSLLFVLTVASLPIAARADFELVCGVKKSSATTGKLCEKAVTAIAKQMGCDISSVTCDSFGGSELTCAVHSMSCEKFVFRPLPEPPKKPEPKPSPEPSPKPSDDPAEDPRTTDRRTTTDDDDLFPTRDRRTTDYPTTDDRTDDPTVTDPKKTDPKADVKTAPVEPAKPEPVDPNRGCRSGFTKITTTEKHSASGASIKGPENYCRADSFERESRNGACAMAWSRETRDLFKCSECVTAIGELRCETDAKGLLKSVNHGCDSYTNESKGNAAFDVRCLKNPVPTPSAQ